MANNTRHGAGSIPLDELKPLTPTNKPKNELNLNTSAATNSHDNLGVDDGLLDGDGVGPTAPKPPTAGPEANEPGENDAEEPESGVPRGGERPRTNPRPRPRPDNPWNKPVEPTYPPDATVNNGINYTTKKNIAQGMMDIALLTANASQLRYVMRSPYWDIYHQVNIALISISIALQIIAGVLLIFISRYDYKRKEEKNVVQIMSDTVVMIIFAITIVNIFIATFGVDDEKTTFLRWMKETDDSSSEPLTSSFSG